MAYTDIDKPSDYFNTLTWTADGTSPRSFTGVGFQPDFVWGKRRSVAADHNLYDVVRGAGSDKALMSNSTDVEGNVSASFGYLSSLDSDGFTTTTGSTNNNYWNNGTDTYVAWNWLAGGTASSNTDGSITSSVSANTTSGFSIVSYTSDGNSGATVGHGLGVAPSVVIVKRRSSAEDWGVGHQSLGWTNFLRLNTTGASSASTGLWNDTAPSSTVVTLGNSGISNVGSGTTMIMYCFAEKKGYSKMGSYVANGSSDGNFIYTGFTPSFILTKCSSTDNGSTFWCIFDNKREGYNGANDRIFPNVSNAESNDSPSEMDILSNGFKIRGVSSSHNISGQSFIYMAFAENPFVTSTGIPACAR